MDNDAKFQWRLDTELVLPEGAGSAVVHAADMLKRDMTKVLARDGRDGLGSGRRDYGPTRIEAVFAAPGDPLYGEAERFSISFGEEKDGEAGLLRLAGSDELGLVYGLLHLSRRCLGVDPLWFWMDAEPPFLGNTALRAEDYVSKPFAVRYRGWFVNDEDSIIGWTDSYPPPREAWYPVFEALLRLGGNMVIPGTDLPRGGCHYELASEMGLYVSFHHAEPLGAEMFKRAYPDLEARYDKHAELFEGLWRQAVARGKHRKAVWTLGFRGQGDKPFWEDDPDYATAESRGALVGSVIERQRAILREGLRDGAGADADDPPTCAYIYGELTELYRGGHVAMPSGTIKVWADNGYGRMVSRRQGNENPRLPSLPEPGDEGPHGIYYHVAFHDLQASNHLTMFPNDARMIRDELKAAFEAGADRFLLVNSANLRHQAYCLDLVAELWREGDADVEEHRRGFCRRFFPSAAAEAALSLEDYSKATLRYGPNEDDHAGEEYYHHCPRSLIACWMRGEQGKGAEDMRWATGELSLRGQFAAFRSRLAAALPGLVALEERAKAAAALMAREDAERFSDFFGFQAGLHRSGCEAFLGLCDAYELFARAEYPRSFVAASASLGEYRRALGLLEAAQRGKWRNFFRCDYLTNVAATAYAVDSLRRWLRQFGDAPDYYRWNRAFAVSESERGLLLENTTRRVLSDDELAQALASAFAAEDSTSAADARADSRTKRGT
jgi:hypothetical protein